MDEITAILDKMFDDESEMEQILDWSMEAREAVHQVYPSINIINLPITVAWENKLKVTAGIARYHLRTEKASIKYSPSLWRISSEQEKRETVFHEVAHIAANRFHDSDVGHRAAWKNMMRKIGYPNAKRCHSLEIPDRLTPFRCKCTTPCLVGKRKKNIILRSNYPRVYCKRCATYLTADSIIVEKQQ